jgi:hypothetical protein
MIGGVQEHLDLRAMINESCARPDSLLTLITLFARFVRCFPSQCGMRAIGSVGGRYVVSATKRRDHSRSPLGCLDTVLTPGVRRAAW